ncbi:ABC transporter permease [Faecalibaculum rodentium]|jgi:putative ABC transport system permease protein|uniref:ABC transporter permease n=2 Tax=Faecalibaculum rodentium TaxID=1702221 RepID=A0A1Q9YJT8_9FIRM|nr:ABC transporter permease [Faecalibaculum rodentium]OLU44794.1 ABC transporter permease [Faecalibaculum rodentium]
MSTGVIIRAVELGLIFSVLSLGEYITVKVMDSPDLTVDGSFVTGGCTAAMLTLAGFPNLGLAAAFVAGLLCGCVTAFLQTKMKIQGLLAGILTMTALYSVNLRIMQGAPNVSLYAVPKPTILNNPATVLYVLIAIVALIALLMYAFFKTNLGLMLRAAGDNEEMIRSSSVNVDSMKFLGFALSNGLVALSGALLVQFQKFADVTGGTGMLVLGLAGIIIGEAVFRRSGIGFGLAASITGAILYRLLYTLALQLGFPATDMNLVSAVLVAVTISIPHLQKLKKKRGSHA